MHVLIVDDHPIVRHVLGTIAARVIKDAQIASAGKLAQAIEQVSRVASLDLVLLDLQLPDCSGFETLVTFRAVCPVSSVMAVSETDDWELVLAALNLGAAGCLLKSLPLDVMAAAINLVAAGGRFIPPQVIEHLRRPHMLQIASKGHGLQPTARQADVLELMTEGLSNKEIARALKIRENTVKQHVQSLFSLFRVSSRSQLVATALRRESRQIL